MNSKRSTVIAKAGPRIFTWVFAVAMTSATATDIKLSDKHDRVVRALGPPIAEWSTQLCPDRSIAIYRSQHAIVKLVFDADRRLHAIGLTALRRWPGQGWPALRWRNVGYSMGSPVSYAAHGGLAPWFYNVSPKEITYFERAMKSSADGGRLYLGSVSISAATDFAISNEFPFDEAQASTEDESRGAPVSSSSLFKELRDWRRRTRPNSFVRVAVEAPGTEERCGGFSVGRISQSDLLVR